MTFVNNNNGNGQPGQFLLTNFDAKQGNPSLIVNNNNNGPSLLPFSINNNNGFSSGSMTVINNNNGGSGGMVFMNNGVAMMPDGTFIQPIYVASENSKTLVGYNIIQNNKIVKTIMNPLAFGPQKETQANINNNNNNANMNNNPNANTNGNVNANNNNNNNH